MLEVTTISEDHHEAGSEIEYKSPGVASKWASVSEKWS